MATKSAAKKKTTSKKAPEPEAQAPEEEELDDRGLPKPKQIIPTERPRKVHPVLKHTGERFEFERMTNEECSNCNPQSAGAKLGVLYETGNMVKVQCEHCDYSGERRKGTV